MSRLGQDYFRTAESCEYIHSPFCACVYFAVSRFLKPSGRHFTSFSNFCRLRPEPRASIAFPSFIRHPRRYRQGDAFFHLRIPTAMSRLKRERAAIERVIERLERKAEGCEGEMKGLKVEL